MSGAAERGRGIWRSLHGDQRLALGAAIALFVSMLLPWYQLTAAPARGALADRNLNAFQVFDFTEAAVLLVAAAVIALVVARAEGGTFSLPGKDGTFVMAGGVWVCLLIFIRQLDKPDGPEGTVVGVAWGIFLAFLAGLALAGAGWRMRQDQAGGPPLLREERHPADPVADATPPPPTPVGEDEAPPRQRPRRRRPAAAPDPDDTAPTLFDDVPEPADPPPPPQDDAPTRPLRPGEIPPAR